MLNLRKKNIRKQTSAEAAVKEVVEDRSAFNCPECKGEGIDVDKNLVCRNCNGTGKV